MTPIDHASGRVHDYYPTAFEVTSLLEQVAVPAMRANATMASPPTGGAIRGAAAEPATPALTPDAERRLRGLTVPREVVVRVTNPANDANASPGAGRPRRDPSVYRGRRRGESVSRRARAVAKLEPVRRLEAQAKYQHGACYRGGMCTTYTVLDTLCVKVDAETRNREGGAAKATEEAREQAAREWRTESARRTTRAAQGGAARRSPRDEAPRVGGP